MQGIYDFVKCLYKNKHLLSLNLGNNNMDEKCGELFEEATRANTTLIDFEFGFNNFSLNDVWRTSFLSFNRSERSKTTWNATKPCTMPSVSANGKRENWCSMKTSDWEPSTCKSNPGKNKCAWKKKPESWENKNLTKNGESTSLTPR